MKATTLIVPNHLRAQNELRRLRFATFPLIKRSISKMAALSLTT